MNNNNNNEKLGLDQPMAPNPQLQTTDDYLLTDATKPQENSFPALKKFAYEPDVDVQTQLVDHAHPLNSGVYSPNNQASVNSSEQAMLRMKLEEQRARQTGKSIYQQAPTSGGFEPYVDVSEPPKPSFEKLEELRKAEQYHNLKRRINNLQQEEKKQETRLQTTRRTLTVLCSQLEELRY